MSEEIKEIKDKIIHPKATPLNMKRVPKESVDVFKKWANDEFVGDYGMAFKKLVDLVLVEPLPFQQINEALVDHEKRLAKIEGKEPKKVRFKKTLSGRKIELPAQE